MNRNKKVTNVIAALALVGLTAAACGSAAPSSQPSAPRPAGTAPSSGPVGTTVTVTTTNIHGDVMGVYKIRLVRVTEPAAPDPEMKSYDPSMYPAGTHLAALLFRVDGVRGTADTSPGISLTATDGTGQVYRYTTAGLASSMPDFSGGTVGPDQHDSGWVAFQVPDGTHLVSVSYSPLSLSPVTVTWTIR